MGIKQFTYFLRKYFSSQMKDVRKGQKLTDKIDVLLIDANGIYHQAAQEIFRYGNHKDKKNPEKIIRMNKINKERFFERVFNKIDDLVMLTRPSKKVVICVDGVAPKAKQVQQRMRRFKSVMDKEDGTFDQNIISPGTELMHHLSKYIDYSIRKSINESENWRNLEVIFSNEKNPGEGEQCIMSYIRKHGNEHDFYCVNGLDADLIMLSLVTNKPNFIVLREDLFNRMNSHYTIDIGGMREELIKLLKWDSIKHDFDETRVIDDFVLMCFIGGNDFLPHIPSIEIIQDGIDVLMSIYKDVAPISGHLTIKKDDEMIINTETLNLFLGTIGMNEKHMMEMKYSKKEMFFTNELLEKHMKQGKHNVSIDIDNYKKDYNKTKLKNELSNACKEYLHGMQWVLSYYTGEVPDWEWYYPYHYAPFASNLANYTKQMKSNIRKKYSKPFDPFLQLLCILPPKSANLLPVPLNKLLNHEDTPLKIFCPPKVEIDLSGLKHEWAGVVLIPFIKQHKFNELYNRVVLKVSDKDKIRNTIINKIITYKFNNLITYNHKSYYGTIEKCKVETSSIYI